MEGPSLVIASEEFRKYLKEPIQKVSGTLPLPDSKIKRARLTQVTAWGKHFLLVFDSFALRVHFLMFGSYRINNPRPAREPKLSLKIAGDTIEFYSCAIKEIDADIAGQYDWSTDLMSKAWSPRAAMVKLRKRENEMICDLLMDQAIFSGLGNIMKNETLFRVRLHPETRFARLSSIEQTQLVREARAYAKQFYRWKKMNVLKKNWQIFRKKTCPLCERAVKKRATGKGQRFSHYCSHCQPKR